MLRAAERLQVAPWELLERPDHRMWIRMANGASSAEAHAIEMKAKHRS